MRGLNALPVTKGTFAEQNIAKITAAEQAGKINPADAAALREKERIAEETRKKQEQGRSMPQSLYYLQAPQTQQFDVADWTQPMYAQPSATTVVSGGTAPKTTILNLGPGQYMDTSTYAPSVDVGAGIMDLYSQAAFKDLSRQVERMSQLPAQRVPTTEMYGPSPTPQLPTMATQEQQQNELEQAQAPQVISAVAVAPESQGSGLIWLVVAGVVGLVLARRGKQ